MSSELVDPSMQMGKSKNRSLKCALVHFTNYLAYARHSKLCFDTLEESDITRHHWKICWLLNGACTQQR